MTTKSKRRKKKKSCRKLLTSNFSKLVKRQNNSDIKTKYLIGRLLRCNDFLIATYNCRVKTLKMHVKRTFLTTNRS
jgi:hypothetical protein